MLTVKTQLDLKNAKEYFRAHLCAGDYYSAEQQIAGVWFGAGAAQLGLEGVVGETAFVRLCEGLNPQTGEKLTLRKNTQRRENGESVANRRVLYDFVLSPPKSVSVLGLMQDVRVLALHDQAVWSALGELERTAETRVRKGGALTSRPTGNIVTAVFRHDTSRELDPHLHSHCVVLNATFDPIEKQWKALEAGGAFRAQKLVEQLYYHELCRGLRKLGYGIESRGRDFEITGVPAQTIARFSKRHAQIDAEAARTGASLKPGRNLKDLREEIARATRKRKTDAGSSTVLRKHWGAQLSTAERQALRALPALPSPMAVAKPDATAAVAWADEHLFERRSVVEETELLATALAHGRGTAITLPELRSAVTARGYLREVESTRLTSREALAAERDLILAARSGRQAHAPFAPEFTPSAKLSTEQERAVRDILSSRDFITVFRGGAGTGKSFALAEVHRGLAAAGFPVVVAAPQRQQVEGLTADGLAAQTLAHVLAARAVPAASVLVVDEAGQIAARQLADLVQLARERHARLILSGDTRQHGAVAASDALRALEAYGHVRIAEITAIRRQDPSRGRSADERQFIARYRAAVKAAAAGDVAGSFARLEKLGCIREIGPADRSAALAQEFVAAVARKESTLVVAQTWSEVHRVNEAIREALRTRGQLGKGKTLRTFRPVDATVAQRRDPSFYIPGQHVYFLRRYGRFAKGDVCEVRGTNARGIILHKAGVDTTVGLRYADRLSVAEAVRLEIAPGDRLQLKLNGRSREGLALNNGELVTVQRVRRDGGIVAEDAAKRVKTIAPDQQLLTRGFAVTSYASQGKTVDTVLFSDAQSAAATNRNQWYVTISRGRRRVLVFTSDKHALRAQIEPLSDRPLALQLKTTQPPARRVEPNWAQRARTVIAHLQRRDFLRQRQSTRAPHPRHTV